MEAKKEKLNDCTKQEKKLLQVIRVFPALLHEKQLIFWPSAIGTYSEINTGITGISPV